MSETVSKPMVAKSVLSKPPRYYYFTRHKPLEGGRGIEVVGRKTDVTDSVEALVLDEMNAFHHWLRDTHGLELLDPNPVTESDGEKYLHGLKEKTGHVLLNEVVADWRKS